MERDQRTPGRLSPEEDTGFHDYTIASSLERLIAAIENSLRRILTIDLPRRSELEAAGPHLPVTFTAHLSHHLPFRSETYSLSLHVPSHYDPTPGPSGRTPLSWAATSLHSLKGVHGRAQEVWPLGDQPHKYQEWFLQGPCVVIAPDSYSGRVLEEQELHTLCSAGATAVNHLGLSWPVLIPVHDALRDACCGMVIRQSDGAHVRLESDSLHSRSVPTQFLVPHGQLAALASRLRCDAPAASAVCAELASMAAVDGGDDQGLAAAAAAAAPVDKNSPRSAFDVRCAIRRCYEFPSASQVHPSSLTNDEDAETDNGSMLPYEEKDFVIEGVDAFLWDRIGGFWYPWAAEDDPIGSLEFDALWYFSLKGVNSRRAPGGNAMQVLEEEYRSRGDNTLAAPPVTSAVAWRLAVLRQGYVPDDGHRPLLLMQSVDQRRQFLRLQSIVEMPEVELGRLSPPKDALPGSASSFYGMLRVLLGHTATISSATTVADLCSDEWWLDQGSYVPALVASHVIQDALRDVFAAPSLPVWPRDAEFPYGAQSGLPPCDNEFQADKLPFPSAGKAAPLSALSTRLALHALRLGNPRGIGILWSRFLRELRFAHWETNIPLPRLPAMVEAGKPSATIIDLRHCLLHQKLQMINICIQRICSQSGTKHSLVEEATPTMGLSRSSSKSAASSSYVSFSDASGEPGDNGGWATDLAKALSSHEPSSTSQNTRMEEKKEGVARELDVALLDSADPNRMINVPVTQEAPPFTEDALSEQLIIGKAQDECLGGDTLHGRLQSTLLLSDMQAFKAANPGCRFEDFIRWHSPRDWNSETMSLSTRMSDASSTWHKLWSAAVPCPAERQRPLFQANLEGERALHFLETLTPAAMHAQIVALSIGAAIELIGRSPAAKLPAVAAQIQRLRDLAGAVLGDAGVAPQTSHAAHGESINEFYIEDSGTQGAAVHENHSVADQLMDKGASFEQVQSLILALGCVEQTVVAAESLLRRCRVLSEPTIDVKENGGNSSGEESAWNDQMAPPVNDLVMAALAHGSGWSSGGYGTVAGLDLEHIIGLVGDDKELGAPHQPFCTEWCIEVFPSVDSVTSSSQKATANTTDETPLHRLFVRLLPGELRVASTITPEMF